MVSKVVIYQSRKKALTITLLSPIWAVIGWLFLHYTDNITAGWCFIILSGMCLIYGIGMWFDRKPYLIITEKGITDMSVIREEIEWEAIRRVGDLYFRGQFFVCLLVDRDYKPDIIVPTWFYRLDRIYATQNVKALYIRPGILEVNSARLVHMIKSMKNADASTRKNLLQKPVKEW